MTTIGPVSPLPDIVEDKNVGNDRFGVIDIPHSTNDVGYFPKGLITSGVWRQNDSSEQV